MAQFVDDISIAANDADQLIKNLRAAFECISEAGLKLTMHLCRFGANQIDFLGSTITPESVKPQKERITNFLEKNKILEVQESLATLCWPPQLLQKLCSKIIRKTGTNLPTP